MKTDRKWCPGCRLKLDRLKDFGKRRVRGRIYAQSLCKKCDSTRER